MVPKWRRVTLIHVTLFKVTIRGRINPRDGKKTIEAVVLYVFIIAFTASIFTVFIYGKKCTGGGMAKKVVPICLLHHDFLTYLSFL